MIIEDYEAICKRIQELAAPPFKMGAAAPGSHCSHCPMQEDQGCSLQCANEYQKRYGINPYAQAS